ncbi:MAG: hypothetical protein ABL934_00615 [Lysobacteraceae bacterium]
MKAFVLSGAHFGTYILRCTKALLIYRRASNLRAALLLEHTKLESTVRYLSIKLEDVLEIAEQTETSRSVRPFASGANGRSAALARCRCSGQLGSEANPAYPR